MPSDALPAGEWRSADDACIALDELAEPLVLCIDDLHALLATAAENELERLVEHLPAGVRILAATRRRPDINLSRLLVAGSLLELGSDDLRFRSWEVEELFRDVYGEPLPPGDLAVLARRTEGWAAGLQLFHLACRGRSPAERRRLLASLGTHFALASEYLARNVLADLEPDLSDFLLETCVLGELTGPLCDELLGTTGSQARLAALAERQVFTRAVDERGATYRYHEVLRRHLELELVERIGEVAARERFRRAGALLESRGALADAIRAQCRAEDWESVARLAAREGERLLTIGDGWLDLLPASLRLDDPWLLLAVARRERSAGRLDAAVTAYSEAEAAFGTPSGADLARRERQALVRFLDPLVPAGSDVAGIVRAATLRDPANAARTDLLDGAERECAAGLGLLLAGRLREAAVRLEDARGATDVPPMLEAVAATGLAAALLLSGRAEEGLTAASDAAELADRLGQAWLARLARAVRTIGDPGLRREAASALAASRREGDRWGCALAGLALGHALAYGANDEAVPMLEESVAAFHGLGANVLEAWARGLLALALSRTSDPEARGAAHVAERTARAAGTRAPLAYTYLALAALEPPRRAEYLALASDTADECGLALPGAQTQSVGPRVALRCLGAFVLTVERTPGRPVGRPSPCAPAAARARAARRASRAPRGPAGAALARRERRQRTAHAAGRDLGAARRPARAARRRAGGRGISPRLAARCRARPRGARRRARRRSPLPRGGRPRRRRGGVATRPRCRRRRRPAARGRAGRLGGRRARAKTHAGELGRRVARALVARTRRGGGGRRGLRARARLATATATRCGACSCRRARRRATSPRRCRRGASTSGCSARSSARDGAGQSFVKSSISAIDAELRLPFTGG